jgi:hypothetical protein
MLTDTIETTTVGNTILLSKGLIDTMPKDEATLASVISLELAHIALGHHIDTRYAFNDRLMFPDEASFRRINMNHSDHDNQEAAVKAEEYLGASMYKDQLSKAGLYWSQLADRGQVLKALNTPKLGDSLLKTDGTPWMTALAKGAPRLNWDDLTQSPALPLGSWLKTDPWDDRVHQLNAKLYAPLNPRDKMPLEVTPVYFRLQRYDEAQSAAKNAAPTQPAAAGDPQAAPQSTGGSQAPAGAPAGSDQQPAPQQNEGPQQQQQQPPPQPQQGGSPNPQK